MVHSLTLWEILTTAALVVAVIVFAAGVAKVVQDRVDEE